ncbi:reverse transcriptase domain-containing protein [Tanacetum coccineum]
MSATANTTPIVTTVTKATNKEKTPKEVDAASRVNILDFCEEHYEDILPVIMDKIRRDKQKEVIGGRAHSSDLAILTRQAQLSSGRTGQTIGIVLKVEVTLIDGTLLAEIVLEVETAPAVSKRHHSRNRDRSCSMKRGRVEGWAMPTWCHMFNSTLIGAARVWFDELPPESIDGYKDLKAAFLAYFMQQKKYVKDPMEIHNIKQRDGATIKDFIERFKVSEWKSNFRGQPKEGRGSSRFTPLTRTPKEILAAEAGKFKPPPPMITPVEKRSSNKFCDFHNDKRHSTDECRNQPKVGKKEAPAKDKSMAIYMVPPWHRMTRQKVTQSFARVSEITFPPLTTSSGTEGPLVIEAKIGGHMIHRMYVDGGSSTKVLYEHCFNRLRPEIKNQMVPTTTSLFCFSGETIWPLGQLRLLVTIGDAEYSTKAWMNFMIVRSLSSYNCIIRRPRIKEIQAVPSTAHGMLKFLVDGGIVTIRSTILIPAECDTVTTSSKEILKEVEVRHENFKVTLHPNFPDQEVTIGGTLSVKGRTELCSLLKENLDIFAWQPSDMTGVPRSVAEHQLNIREGYLPVRQKKGAMPLNVPKPSW